MVNVTPRLINSPHATLNFGKLNFLADQSWCQVHTNDDAAERRRYPKRSVIFIGQTRTNS